MKSPWQRRGQRDADLDDEIRAHFSMAVRDRIARGESPSDAEAAARREFGNVAHVKEVTREMWGGVWFERLLQDLRYAFRSLARAPGFTAVAILTLALGIGANTAMFTVLSGVLLRPLPFSEPDRLFAASYNRPPPPTFSTKPAMSDGHYLELEKNDQIFDRVGSYSSQTLTLTGTGEPLRVSAVRATPSLFSVLRAPLALGRGFDASEGTSDGGLSVILSNAFWRSRFSADPKVLGTSVTIEGVRRTIVGVTAPSFDYPAGTDLWLPWRVTVVPNNVSMIAVIGRLKAGITPDQAQRAFASMASHLELLPMMHREELVAEVVPLKTVLVGDVRGPLFLFAGAVGFVLLIACANVANLLLMRVSMRDREIALRAALGAGRWRLIRQLLTETFTLTAIGAAGGVLVAFGAVRLLLSLAPAGMIPRAEGIHLDVPTLLFTAGLTLLTAVVCGLVPAMHATERRLHASIAMGGRAVAGVQSRVRSMLVIGEIALALVLLTGAGLLVRSFHQMQTVKLGFDPASVLAVTVDLPSTYYRTAADIRAFDAQVLTNLGAIPGVASVGAINWRPLGGAMISGGFTIENGPQFPPNYQVAALSVTPGYFRSMGIRIERGRDFSADDRADAPGVAVVSRSVADKFWPGESAVGKRITSAESPRPEDWRTVIGVVNDVVQGRVTTPPVAATYVPIEQTSQKFFLSRVTFVMRPAEDGAPIAATVRKVLRDADPYLAVETVTPMSDLVARTTLTPRFQSRILLTFSLIALALAVIGIYGVLAYGVTQRLKEIGVRIALGAAPGEVTAMVLRRTLVLAIPGVALGIGASLGLTRLLATFLFQVTPTDPATFAFVALLLFCVALAAAFVPARRAARVDPMIALRE